MYVPWLRISNTFLFGILGQRRYDFPLVFAERDIYLFQPAECVRC